MDYLKEAVALTIATVSLGSLPTAATALTLAGGEGLKTDNLISSGFLSGYGNFAVDAEGNPIVLPQSGSEIIEGYITIDAIASDNPQALYTDLVSLGLQFGSQYERIVSGLMPVAALSEMENLNSLKFYRQSQYTTHIGSVTSQADIAMRSDVARDIFGVDGSGVTVGVLSDSFNNLGGAASDIASGDLPGSGNPFGNDTPVNVLLELPSGGIDEGRAMLQLIHDVAPGADLAFNTAVLGQASFANGILNLANVAGADVIVDDIIFFAEPMFSDGIIAQAVDQVVADGASYFSSAGNSNRDAYESSFTTSGINLPGFGELHDFDPGVGVDLFQSITVPEGTGFTLSFQWDSPFFSVSGGDGSPNDLEILLIDDAITTILAGSATDNVGGDPVEIFNFFNDGSFGTDLFNLAITGAAGPIPEFMKYVLFGFSGTINEFDTNSGTLYGHANAEGAEAVGAAFYQETPEFGVNPPLLEPFSSAGPTPIFFDTEGNRLAEPQIRLKPEIVAPDGTNTTFFSPGVDVEGDGFENFFGTSAAAPHAAAVAALMLEAAPGTSPEVIYDILEQTAIDIDDPLTPGFDVGFDFASGSGLIQADQAVEVVAYAVPEPTSAIALLAMGTLGMNSWLKRKQHSR